jgi:hypothetical protein
MNFSTFQTGVLQYNMLDILGLECFSLMSSLLVFFSCFEILKVRTRAIKTCNGVCVAARAMGAGATAVLPGDASADAVAGVGVNTCAGATTGVGVAAGAM